MTPRARRCAALLLAVGVAACAGKQQPAADLLGRVQVAVLAGAEDESHYAPDEFRGLQMRLAALQTAFDAKQYDVVQGNGPALLAAMKGAKWMSPRGPVEIDPDTRDIVQNIYIRKVEKKDGQLYNVEFATIPMVKDPFKASKK